MGQNFQHFTILVVLNYNDEFPRRKVRPPRVRDPGLVVGRVELNKPGFTCNNFTVYTLVQVGRDVL